MKTHIRKFYVKLALVANQFVTKSFLFFYPCHTGVLKAKIVFCLVGSLLILSCNHKNNFYPKLAIPILYGTNSINYVNIDSFVKYYKLVIDSSSRFK